mgnify:CR=1 FL=1
MTEALEPIIPDRVEALVAEVLETACRRDLQLATAESCTGGLLASLLTDVPGCSHAFERGFVTYTDAAKHELLGVPLDLLADHGPVSEEAARAMAEGALARSSADVAMSVTGWAEAGPGPGDHAGLVWFGCVRRGRSTVARRTRFGDVGRAQVRLRCLEVALEMMRTALD